MSSLSLSSLALLTMSGVAHAGDPVADTWFASGHDFSSDDCDPDVADSLIGYIYGLGAADEVHGSRQDSSDYSDVLSAGAGDDISWGHDGDDEMHLGDGDDIAWAGPGNDTINMDAGTNEASGEDGNDTFVGGTGSDRGHGGDGTDSMDGHEGQDFLCGGDDPDTLDGGSGDDDQLDGQGGADTHDGGPGSGDACATGTNTNCEDPLSSAPTECPDEHEGS